MAAKKCWEIRPCDDGMQSHCAHADVRERCPAKCNFARCWSKRHELADDPFAILTEVEITEDWPVKEECLSCDFFQKSNKK